MFTSTAGSAPVRSQNSSAAPAVTSAAPASAIISAPLGRRAHDSRSSALGLATPARQLLANPAVRPGSTSSQDAHEHVGRVQHGAAVEARVQVTAPGAHLHRPLDEAARAGVDRGRALVGHQRVEHDHAVGLWGWSRR